MDTKKRLIVRKPAHKWYMAIPFSQIKVCELQYLYEPIVDGDMQMVLTELPDGLGSLGLDNVMIEQA